MRLTLQTVARLSLPPGKGEAIFFDDTLPGFGVRLRAGGKRTWIAQYRVGSKQRRVTLGTVEVLDPERARKAARQALAQVQLGGDPQIEKAQAKARASVTLGVVADRYLNERASAKLKPRSYYEVDRHLKLLWVPLRELPVDKVRRANVAARLGEIAAENGRFAANRARASLSAMFSWAMGEGLADANPVIGTNRPTEEVKRDHVVTDDELAAIWRASQSDDYGRIIRLLILTAQRRDEVGAMAAAEISADAKAWMIPSSRTKNGLAHEVPLSQLAQRLLTEAPRREGRALIFGSGDGGYSGWSKAKTALDQRIKEKGDKVRPWRLHDLRRTAATRMGDLGVLPHVVEAVLNHISGHKAGVAGVYNRAVYAEEKRKALDTWSKHVSAVCEKAKKAGVGG